MTNTYSVNKKNKHNGNHLEEGRVVPYVKRINQMIYTNDPLTHRILQELHSFIINF